MSLIVICLGEMNIRNFAGQQRLSCWYSRKSLIFRSEEENKQDSIKWISFLLFRDTFNWITSYHEFID